MAGHRLQARGIARRNKMLKAATFLFLDQGYEKTTTTQNIMIPLSRLNSKKLS